MTATNELEKLREACSSEDSRAALDRMQSFIIGGIEAEESALRLAGCASKVCNHRIRTAVFVVSVTLASPRPPCAGSFDAAGYAGTVWGLYRGIFPAIIEKRRGMAQKLCRVCPGTKGPSASRLFCVKSGFPHGGTFRRCAQTAPRPPGRRR